MHKYFKKYNELHNLNNLEESKEIVEITRDIYNNAVKNQEECIKNKNRKIKERYIPFERIIYIKSRSLVKK